MKPRAHPGTPVVFCALIESSKQTHCIVRYSNHYISFDKRAKSVQRVNKVYMLLANVGFRYYKQFFLFHFLFLCSERTTPHDHGPGCVYKNKYDALTLTQILLELFLYTMLDLIKRPYHVIIAHNFRKIIRNDLGDMVGPHN